VTEEKERSEIGSYGIFEENLEDIEKSVLEAYRENELFQATVRSNSSSEEIVEDLEDEVRSEENRLKKTGECLGYVSNGAAVLFGAAYAATAGPLGLSMAASGVCGIEYMRRMSNMDSGTNPEREYLSARVGEDLEVEAISEDEDLYRLELEPEYDDSDLFEKEVLDYSFL